MTVQEIIDKLKDMPPGCHVFVEQVDGRFALATDAEYSDTLTEPGADDSNQTDGVVIKISMP